MLFVPTFKIVDGKNNVVTYINNIKENIDATNKSEEIEKSISETKEELVELRGADAVDMTDGAAIYDSVTSLPGVLEKGATLLQIKGGNVSEKGAYDGKNKALAKRADGIQIDVKVRDINAFLERFNALKIPTMSINVLYTDNRVILTFYTNGGRA